MTFGIIEYTLMALIVIGLPIWATFEYRRFVARVAAGVAGARVREYRFTIGMQWMMAAAVVAVWLSGGHELTALGFGVETGLGFWIVGGLTVAACVGLIAQTVAVVRSPENLAKARAQFESFVALIPHDEDEGRWFTALSITAGICEEIIYRGFMLALVAAVVGAWPAVLITALFFGFAHAYQGGVGIAKTAAVGLVMGALFVISGSLWAPMLLHAVVDITSGYTGRRALTDGAAASPAPTTA